MQYFNSPGYLLEVKGSIETPRLRLGEPKVEFGDAAVMSSKDCGKQWALQVFTLKNIRFGEELFADCGTKYSFSSIRGLSQNSLK